MFLLRNALSFHKIEDVLEFILLSLRTDSRLCRIAKTTLTGISKTNGNNNNKKGDNSKATPELMKKRQNIEKQRYKMENECRNKLMDKRMKEEKMKLNVEMVK